MTCDGSQPPKYPIYSPCAEARKNTPRKPNKSVLTVCSKIPKEIQVTCSVLGPKPTSVYSLYVASIHFNVFKCWVDAQGFLEI